MMYSLEQFIFAPPLTTLASMGLLAGLDALGLAFLTRTGLMQLAQDKSLRYQSVVLGALLLSALLFPVVLLGLASLALMRVIGAALLLAGLLHIVLAVGKLEGWTGIKTWVMASPWSRSLVLANLAGLFLLALGPVTSADALDYHIGAAIAMLNNGGMPNSPEWFHSRFAGNGEVLNALGLAVGAEQFGSLIQWASLAAIVSLFWPSARQDSTVPGNARARPADLLVISAISTPVLLFLISGPKPQLWPIAMTTLAFALLAHPSIDQLDRPALRKRFALACALCMSAALAKFNFLLGGGLVGCFAVFTMFRRRDLVAALVIGASLAVFIVLPVYVWKAHTYGSGLLEAILNPLPGHLPGTDRMIAYAKNNSDFSNSLPFPLSILVSPEPGGLSTVLGIGWIILLFALRPGASKQARVALLLVVSITLISLVTAPPSARMYMEPYYWGLFLCSLTLDRGEDRVPVAVGRLVWLQAAAFLLACWFGVYALFPGALTGAWREKIMERAANGYSLMRWADQVLPADAVLLNGHRSMALAPRRALDYNWTNYVAPSTPEALPYLSRIKKAGVTHILIAGPVTPTLPLHGCFGNVYAGPGPGRSTARNPFNQGAPFDAWLLEFHSERLPACATP